MITLNDYLYSGDTLLRILQNTLKIYGKKHARPTMRSTSYTAIFFSRSVSCLSTMIS